MEIVPLTSERRAAWDDFCRTSPDAWFWHTTAWIDWNVAYRPEMAQKSLSFMCKEGDRVMAVVPLLLGTGAGDGAPGRSFSFSGSPVPGPALAEGLSPARRAKLMEGIFELIEGLALEAGAAHARFKIEPLSPARLKPRYAAFNDLLRHRYLDCTIGTQLIDLRLSEAELWDEVRRDHQRNIGKARESLTIHIHSGASMPDEAFEGYRLMHARAAGRVTRPQATFDMMRDWIRSGDGFIAEARLADGKSVGFETFHSCKGSVYSMSACNEPGYERLPIRHLMQWEAMLWMKAKGIEFYEVGDQRFGVSLHDFPSRKNLDISLFKSGFGGVTVPVFRAERFYGPEVWDAENRRRSALFASGYPWKLPADADGARSLLKLIEDAAHPPAPKAAEIEPIPDAARALAAEAMAGNPDSVQSHLNGSTKAVAFLVGAAMKRAPKGLDARLVRRAIEERLAQVVAEKKRT